MGEVFEGRNAEILESIINDTEYTAPPESRIEELLLELKEVIEQGGGGSSYNETELFSTTNPDLSANAVFNLSDDISNFNTFIFKIKTSYKPLYVYVPTSEILTGDEFIVYGNIGGNQYQTLKKTGDNQLTSPGSGGSGWGILKIMGI